ncbi:hypothetical protein [Dyadobacter fermentans]|uniref:hypothetical protein n=1 Tax=Dyadobacter fermentans TaxID=94254 RepID=UPI001CBF410F|nr:hypothetical protein [Dyadobacter fermentans]MBZ1362169.1 hypothetical protein [Dyadobacter fermentans]
MEGTIKERLLKRFTGAREKLGPNWKKRVKEANPFYATDIGHVRMGNVAGAVTRPRSAGPDTIEQLVITMEGILKEELAEV